METTAEKDFPLEITVSILASYCLVSGREMHFSTWIHWFPPPPTPPPSSRRWGMGLQLEHSLGPSHRPSCLSFPHHWHFTATLQHWFVWPNLSQLKQRIMFGTNKATFTFRYPTVISLGISGVLSSETDCQCRSSYNHIDTSLKIIQWITVQYHRIAFNMFK